MALILEIRDRRGHPTWYPLSALPLTIGRGLSNDIILDDPYADAAHARIAADDTGAVILRDLGTVNGVRANGARVADGVTLTPGTELRIGRTTLRVRDRDEPVPAALVETGHRLPKAAQWALTPGGSLILAGLVAVATALTTWLGNSERSSGGTVFAAVLAAVAFVIIWAAIWGVATRGHDRRFHLLSHMAVISAAFLTMLLAGMVNQWLVFFFPDVTIVGLIASAVLLCVTAAVVAGHLTVAGALTRRGRWIAGLSVSGALLVLIALGSLVEDEKFSDVPKFPGQLKSLSPTLVPTKSVDEFIAAMAEAKSEADDAIKP